MDHDLAEARGMTMDFRMWSARGHGQSARAWCVQAQVVLAVLLLHPNEVVSVSRVVDELWGDVPPATAAKVVQATHIQPSEKHWTRRRSLPGLVAISSESNLTAWTPLGSKALRLKNDHFCRVIRRVPSRNSVERLFLSRGHLSRDSDSCRCSQRERSAGRGTADRCRTAHRS